MPSINRVVMQKTTRGWLKELDLASMDAAEISGKHGRRYEFKSYKIYRYPKHDICKGPILDNKGRVRQYDIVLANQVWEHLDRPYAATCNVLDMLRPGGYFYIGEILHQRQYSLFKHFAAMVGISIPVIPV